jgi:tetratricopeptide (TPR) repeat protein
MRNLTNRFRVILLLATVVVAHAATLEPAPATIITADKPIENAWVESETVDGVLFYLGEWWTNKRVVTTRKPGQYISVQYQNSKDPSFIRAEALYKKGDYASAPEFYQKAIASCKWRWEVEQAHLRAADCLVRIGKNDEALTLLKQYVDRFPQNVHMGEVVSTRAKIAFAAGNYTAANADFVEMAKQAEKWGPNTKLNGMIGQRDVLVAQKKFADAINLLRSYWSTLKADKEPHAFAQVGITIARDLDADGKATESIATLTKVYLAPVAAEAQALARLHHAQLLAKANDTENNFAAFDHVAIAAMLGGDEATAGNVAKLARELIGRIESDKNLSDEVRREYRSYRSRF